MALLWAAYSHDKVETTVLRNGAVKILVSKYSYNDGLGEGEQIKPSDTCGHRHSVRVPGTCLHWL